MKNLFHYIRFLFQALMEVFVQMIPPVSLGVRQINTGFTLPELLRFLCEPEMFCLIVCQYF